MESDLFLKSSFFNNFEEFSLEVMNRKKEKKKKKAISHPLAVSSSEKKCLD